MWFWSACISRAVASVSLEGDDDGAVSAMGTARLDCTSIARGLGACKLLRTVSHYK